MTLLIRELSRTCPNLIQNMLPQLERHQLQQVSHMREDLEPDVDSLSSIVADDAHEHVTVTSRIRATYCSEKLKLPVRASDTDAQLTQQFKEGLCAAFREDYGLQIDLIIQLNKAAIQWYKKVSYTDKYILAVTTSISLLIVLPRGLGSREHGAHWLSTTWRCFENLSSVGSKASLSLQHRNAEYSFT